MKARLLNALPNAGWYEFESVSRDSEREGTRLAFGKPHRPHLKLQKARRIVALDSDFLMTHPESIAYAGDFAAGRKGAGDQLSRLIVFESNFSVTGSMADSRYPVRNVLVPAIAQQLYLAISQLDVADSVGVKFDSLATALPVNLQAVIQSLAEDLVAHKGECVVVAGSRQSAEVHAVVAALNIMLGSVGKTVAYTESPEPNRSTHNAAIRELAQRMDAGEIDTLVILASNPVETVSDDLNFANLIDKVPASIHLSKYVDETSRLCDWHVPQAHFLESWSDARAFDGTYSIVQPLIAPLYDGRTVSELLALVIGDEATTAHAIAKRTFSANFAHQTGGADIESIWRNALHDGVVTNSAWPHVVPNLRSFEFVSKNEKAAAARNWFRDLPGRRLQPVRRTICQQCLAAGMARSDFQTDMGQRCVAGTR